MLLFLCLGCLLVSTSFQFHFNWQERFPGAADQYEERFPVAADQYEESFPVAADQYEERFPVAADETRFPGAVNEAAETYKKNELVGVLAKVGVEAALAEIDNVWKGDVVRYWKCAVENRSDKTLYAYGTTSVSGSIATPFSDIPPGSTGFFVWEKSRGAATGAIGVVHYQYGNKILNLMASIPYDWNLYGSWSNVRLSNNKESYYNLYNGKNGARYPTKGGNWGNVDNTKFFLTDKSHAEFKVIFSG